MWYEVSVSYPWEGSLALDADIVEAVGIERGYDSGVGVGYRDLQFSFATHREALDAAQRIVAAHLPGVVVVVSGVED